MSRVQTASTITLHPFQILSRVVPTPFVTPCRSGDITFDELTELLDDEHMGRGLDGQRAECVHTPSAVDAACTAVVVPREHFK